MTRKTSKTKPTPAPVPASFLVDLIGSIGESDPNGTVTIAAMVPLADTHVPALLAGGVFNIDRTLADTITKLVPEYERAREMTRSYTKSLARYKELADTGKFRREDDAVLCEVRYMERDAAFALGIALGMRIAGAR